jgi:hypothetical protein
MEEKRDINFEKKQEVEFFVEQLMDNIKKILSEGENGIYLSNREEIFSKKIEKVVEYIKENISIDYLNKIIKEIEKDGDQSDLNKIARWVVLNTQQYNKYDLIEFFLKEESKED